MFPYEITLFIMSLVLIKDIRSFELYPILIQITKLITFEILYLNKL